MKKINLIVLSCMVLFAFGSCSSDKANKEKRLSDYVNPFIGASTSIGAAGTYHGLGKTFPGAATPYGMTQVSPNTITGGDNGSGYSYEHKTIEGFAFTQMSGVGWNGDLGNFLVMPTTGQLKTASGKEDSDFIDGYRSYYDKKTENASAGYYSVMLTDYNIKVEASAAPHSGILKFVFPENTQSRIQIDLARRVGGTATYQFIEILDDKHIRGWMKCPPEGGGWGNSLGSSDYVVHFYGEFSKPFSKTGFYKADIPNDWSRLLESTQSNDYQKRIDDAEVIYDQTQCEGNHIGFFTEFETKANEEVSLKVGISFVDMEGAQNNFEKEIKDKTFETIVEEAKKSWDDALAKIIVDGNSDEDKKIFYTSFYHTMIDPRIYTDVDGRYVGGDKKIYNANGFTKRTVFSGWDVFRAQFPLQTIINPQLVNDQLNSLITLAEQSGREYFERWELLNAYSGCMIGNPALSVLADAYMKNIRDYDVEKAYRYAINSSDKFSPSDDMGYYGNTRGLSISNTLEYAYFDWCLALIAKDLGKDDDVEKLLKRSKYYRNVFDHEKGWFRPRMDDGSWEPWKEDALITEWYGCIESNPYQQAWFVPHDIEDLVTLIGGLDMTLEKLNYFFENAPKDFLWNQYYNHANEPVHHVPFLFNRLGTPWDTQKWSRIICKNAYSNSVEGLVGNEDAGQMSAWYILASAGLYPVCPGETRYEITSPVFDKIVMKTPATGKDFTIIAHNNSGENMYIQSAKLNGEDYNKCFLDHSDIIKGSTLELFMGSEPNKNWGVAK
ncbi:GH92 family glycosyl hydrolase [Bacteroidales bacterium OttesenSCG-928-I14]|nr:GH92 family glycosyl hydrolase [Bacteroidales bacterium OttesenSCG-928-I14]